MDKKDAINWFVIHSSEYARAKNFYETILQTQFMETSSGSGQMAIFPHTEGNAVGGAIVQMPDHAPGAGGTLVYLNVEGDLDGVLSRVPTAGGEVLKPRFAIGEHGFIGVIRDSEGNAVGLHSMV